MSGKYDQNDNTPEWADQLSAYNPEESFALSASAGSGKTFALTTRLLAMLLSGRSCGEILAITFTNLAANEIRDGLFKRLDALENRKPEETGIYAGLLKTDGDTLQKQAKALRYKLVEQFSVLRVSTIHSFLGRMLFCFPKETGYMFDLSIIDEREREKLLSESIEDFYRLLAVDMPLFDRILDFIRVYREGRTKTGDIILDIYGKVSAKRYVLTDLVQEEAQRKGGVISEYAAQKKRIWSGETVRRVRLLAGTVASYMEEHGEQKDLGVFVRDLNEFLESRNPKTLIKMPAFRREERQGPIRYLKKFFRDEDDKEPSPFQKAFEALRRDIRLYVAGEMEYYIDTWFEIFRRIHLFYEERKKKRHVIDFDDIEILAFGLLEKLSDYGYLDFRLDSRIRCVLIDEFQDTSESQWEVLKAIVRRALAEGGNFFYVGDIKQSIYRFRGGEPWLFGEVKKNLRLPERSLEYNFRQNGLLLGLVNDVFERISTEVFPEYGYKTQLLPPGRAEQDGGCILVERYEEKEALLAGLVDTVRGLEIKGVSLSDIAVLCRRNSEAKEVESLFFSHRIQYRTSGRSPLLLDPAVLDVVNLLKLCVRPAEPVLFAGFLRSRMAGFSYEELDHLDGMGPDGLKQYDPHLGVKLRAILEGSRYMSPAETVWRIYDELSTLAAYPHNTEALLDLLETAVQFENGNEIPTLERFLGWLEESGLSLSIKSGAGRGVVVQTIHKAKGLEYHTVILPYLSKTFKFRLDNSLLYTRNEKKKVDTVGIAGSAYAVYLDMENMIEQNDIEYRIDELNALYVALTRARENLVVLPLAAAGETIGDIFLSAFDPGYKRKNGAYRRMQGSVVPSREKDAYVKRSYEQYTFEEKPPKRGFLPDEPSSVQADLQKRRAGLLKGLLLHKALEMSKKLPLPDGIDNLIDRAMALVGFPYTNRERQTAKARVKRALLDMAADSRLFLYFSDEAAAEIEMLSLKYKNLLGRVDRACISDIISIIDFKTDEPKEGRDFGELVRSYTGQISSYCGAFANIFPERPVEGWLYFTEAPLNERLVKVYEKEGS
jgi:ATP-dependent exoDNAse (exonuclease V) beta subunit